MNRPQLEIEDRNPQVQTDEHGGSVFELKAEPSPMMRKPLVRAILTRCGYIFGENDEDVLLPDNERLINACQANGVPIRIVDDDSSESALSGLASGGVLGKVLIGQAHPVNIKNLGSYMHDIGPDHILLPALLKDSMGQMMVPMIRASGGIIEDDGQVYIDPSDLNRLSGYYEILSTALNRSMYKPDVQLEDALNRFEQTLGANPEEVQILRESISTAIAGVRLVGNCVEVSSR